jgi:hypothetical protein
MEHDQSHNYKNISWIIIIIIIIIIIDGSTDPFYWTLVAFSVP